MKPNRATVALLASLLDAARSGELQEAFVVFRADDGSYDSAFDVEDLDDMLLQVRTEVIKAQSAVQHINDAAAAVLH